jgi:hypothetical protein
MPQHLEWLNDPHVRSVQITPKMPTLAIQRQVGSIVIKHGQLGAPEGKSMAREGRP